jgi:chromosome segregation ATPase
MELEQFTRLEAKVVELTRRYRSIKDEKDRLVSELKAAQVRSESLEKELGELKNTRQEVLRRVDGLIHRLESEGDEPATGPEREGSESPA